MRRDPAAADSLQRKLEIPMIVVSIAVIPLLFIEHTAITPAVQTAAWVANIAIWLAFVAEYGAMMWVVPDKWHYTKTHWLDVTIILLSPPVFVPEAMASIRALRSLRVLRVLRGTRALRVARAARFVRVFAFAGRALQGTNRALARHSFHYVIVVCLLILIAAGTLFYLVEEGGAVTGLVDGIWWAVTTMTTVGYGDIAPTTLLGRCLAMVVMLVGIGFMAVLTANIAAWFVDRDKASGDGELVAEIQALKEELAMLRVALEDGVPLRAGGQGPSEG